MKNQLAGPAIIFSWPALFITIWLDRDLNDANRDLDTDRAHAARNASSRRRRPSRLLTKGSNAARPTSDTVRLAAQQAKPNRAPTSANDGSPSQFQSNPETALNRTGVSFLGVPLASECRPG